MELGSASKIRREGDRLLGFRDTTNVQVSHFNLFNQNEEEDEDDERFVTTPMKSPYRTSLSRALFGDQMKGALEDEKILSMTMKAPPPTPKYHETLRVAYSVKYTTTPQRRKRHIQSKEVLILDAPGIKNNFYTEIIEWSKNNILAIALGNALFYCKMSNNRLPTTPPSILFESEEEEDEEDEEETAYGKITSLVWSPVTDHLCVAVTEKKETTLRLWDVITGQQIRALQGHTERVHTMDWKSDASILSSGSSDKTIRNWDVRVADARISTLEGHHTSMVTGVRWNPGGTELVSGGNDNIANVWSPSSSITAPRLTLSEHSAAVKGIAWCPWQETLLATGGGFSDKTIKTWNTTTGVMLDSVDTGDQVTSLLWARSTKELISSHGNTQHNIVVWSYPSMKPFVDWNTHTKRIVDMTLSPDEKTLLSASGDESIKFWALLPPEDEVTEEQRAYSISTIR